MERGNSAQSRLYETDKAFFMGPDTYRYFRRADGYERMRNTLGNQYDSGDGIKFRGEEGCRSREGRITRPIGSIEAG